ncbi:MAG: RNA polymerase factor sigma-54 [Deltaproteobacteria bacterium]|nr:RNA polymerase factor sigma-54 [Deltaproteobacteria bacterium]
MVLQLRQTLSLSQQLIMTPQLQQAIKLLQLSRLELLDTINQEMEDNPLLDEQHMDDIDEEKGISEAKEVDEDKGDTKELSDLEVKVDEQIREDIDWETYISDYNTGWVETPYNGKELPPFENMTSNKTSLNSHLMWQLNMSSVNYVQRDIGIHIIGNIDENGYLKISVEEMSEITGRSREEVSETLSLIQQFDPVGVAARDTRECLLIQARFRNLDDPILEKIITYHMDNLENKRYDRIAKSLAIPLQDVLYAVSTITGLEPKPGRMYNDDETIYISPDIHVFKVGDDYEIVLNEDGMPKLRINNYYRNILYNKDSLLDTTKQYIQEKLKSAAWLIKSIHQRQRTIYKVTESIVQFQRRFLDEGVAYLKPLVLRDVAEHIQMHESTISRVTTNKYVHTPQGIFELKYFFNSAINSMDGEFIASESVKEHIKNIIKSENKAKPYSDQEVADMLTGLNINIARRTVAKYRETMGILPSRKRRMPY